MKNLLTGLLVLNVEGDFTETSGELSNILRLRLSTELSRHEQGIY